jgi:calcium-dependent protein kinase
MGASESKPQKEIRIDHYVVIGVLSETATSVHFQATDTITNSRVVLKLFTSSDCGECRIAARLRGCGHPNVVPILDVFRAGAHLAVVTPLASCTLLQYVRPNAEFFVRGIMRQLLSGIAFLHSIGITHRDIKPQNILIMSAEPRIAITDFDLASERAAETDVAGTPAFMAPEVFTGCGSAPADVWAAGIVMFAILTGTVPFYWAETQQQMQAALAVRPVPYPDHMFGRFSEDCMDLLRRLLTKDPSRRVTAAEALKHRWFRQLDISRQSESVGR